jgi:hypothetical protein
MIEAFYRAALPSKQVNRFLRSLAKFGDIITCVCQRRETQQGNEGKRYTQTHRLDYASAGSAYASVTLGDLKRANELLSRVRKAGDRLFIAARTLNVGYNSNPLGSLA